MNVDKCKILRESKTIAIVGLSSKSDRISREIAAYLQRKGYHIYGVNPNDSFKNAGSIKVYNNLTNIEDQIDIVNVFRKSEDIPFLLDDILKIKPKYVWFQLGIRNDSAAKILFDNEITVVQDSCIKVDHSFCK